MSYVHSLCVLFIARNCCVACRDCVACRAVLHDRIGGVIAPYDFGGVGWGGKG